MKVKLTNTELVNAYNTLVKLGEKEMDPVIGLRIARNRLALQDDVRARDEALDKILEAEVLKDKEGKRIRDEKNNFILIDPERYLKRVNQLGAAEIEADVRPMKFEDLRQANPTPNQLLALIPFMEDAEEID